MKDKKTAILVFPFSSLNYESVAISKILWESRKGYSKNKNLSFKANHKGHHENQTYMRMVYIIWSVCLGEGIPPDCSFLWSVVMHILLEAHCNSENILVPEVNSWKLSRFHDLSRSHSLW